MLDPSRGGGRKWKSGGKRLLWRVRIYCRLSSSGLDWLAAWVPIGYCDIFGALTNSPPVGQLRGCVLGRYSHVRPFHVSARTPVLPLVSS